MANSVIAVPEFDKVTDKVHKNQRLNKLEQFILEENPPIFEETWRMKFIYMVNYVVRLGLEPVVPCYKTVSKKQALGYLLDPVEKFIYLFCTTDSEAYWRNKLREALKCALEICGEKGEKK